MRSIDCAGGGGTEGTRKGRENEGRKERKKKMEVAGGKEGVYTIDKSVTTRYRKICSRLFEEMCFDILQSSLLLLFFSWMIIGLHACMPACLMFSQVHSSMTSQQGLD